MNESLHVESLSGHSLSVAHTFAFAFMRRFPKPKARIPRARDTQQAAARI